MSYQTDQQATTDSLVISMEWGITGMPSCCSARVLSRLAGGYRSTQYGIHSVGLQTIPWRGYNNKVFVDYVKSMDTLCDFGLPLDLAFGAVLGDLHQRQATPGLGRPREFLYFASDNIRMGRGDDVHHGPFSTQQFITWAARLGYIEMAHANISYLEGYVFALSPTIKRDLQQIRYRFRRYIHALIANCPFDQNRADRDGGWDDFLDEDEW